MHDVRSIFARHALRCTAQRQAIYAALAATDQHPTASELHAMVSRMNPAVSLATVYNTLEVFARKGLCVRIPAITGDASSARFDADTSEHAHFVCDTPTGTGAIRDLPPDLQKRISQAIPRDLLDEIEDRLGVQVDSVSLKLIGRSTGSGGAC
jgi:Fe2+ or Zn2+ uptake regulation protein